MSAPVLAPIADPVPLPLGSAGRLLARLAASVRSRIADRYRPERHYMRGPGPACRRAAAARMASVGGPALPARAEAR